MIYPAFQKSRITEWTDCLFSDIVVSGYENEFAASEISFKKNELRKVNKLYIDISKENTRRTEYIEEANRMTDEKFIINSKKRSDGLHLKLTVSGKKSLFRAACRIRQMLDEKKFFVGEVEDYPLFAKRGYIEGFYGKPWDFETRISNLDLLSFYGMNTHYYAPKDDPYHRDKWDELYPEKELKQLSELAEICKEKFVDFHYCIAPGLSMKYSSDADFEKLCRKVEQLYNIGIRNFGLLLDDIPENLWFDEDKAAFDGEAVNAHIALINKFNLFLTNLNENCSLTVCPLQYHGRGDEYFISKLGRGIPSKVSLFWTGKNICSQELTVREAVVFENATNHKPLYWDNFPVNDAEMQNEMHIGYINGREKDLYRYSEGLISNVMEFGMSSRIPLLTVCAYLWNPIEYSGYESWQKACEIVLKDKKELFMPLLDNLLFSCLKVENSPMMNSVLNEAQQMFFAGDINGAFSVMQTYIEKLKKCVEFTETVDTPEISELLPWAEKQKIALELLESATATIVNNSDENKQRTREILKKYLAHPKTLCDFSLQSFAERTLTI